MDEHQATFSIETRSEAHAVERLLERLYDSVREETRTVREGSGDATETLAQFRALRDAAKRQAPGTLTVVYEQEETAFEG